MRRRDTLRLALSGAALTFTDCSRSERNPRRLQVASSPYVENSGFYVAQEKGYFRDLGLEVEVSSTRVSAQATPLLAGGALDVGLFVINASLVNAIAAGARIRIVAGKTTDTPECPSTAGIFWREGAFPPGLEGVRQLRGKKIAAGRAAGIAEYFLGVVLEAAGMTAEDVEIVRLRPADSVAGVAGGSLDAIVGGSSLDWDPAELVPGLVAGLRLSEVLTGLQTGFVQFGKRLLDGDPAIGADFLAAYFQGVRAFHEGANPRFLEDRAKELRRTVLKPEDLCRERLTSEGTIDYEQVEHFIRWAVKQGYCEDPPDLGDIVDERFLELAQQRMRGTEAERGRAPVG